MSALLLKLESIPAPHVTSSPLPTACTCYCSVPDLDAHCVSRGKPLKGRSFPPSTATSRVRIRFLPVMGVHYNWRRMLLMPLISYTNWELETTPGGFLKRVHMELSFQQCFEQFKIREEIFCLFILSRIRLCIFYAWEVIQLKATRIWGPSPPPLTHSICKPDYTFTCVCAGRRIPPPLYIRVLHTSLGFLLASRARPHSTEGTKAGDNHPLPLLVA